MRDIQLDWKGWSPLERVAAAVLMILASFAVGAVVFLQT
jgi:hypothetical protein